MPFGLQLKSLLIGMLLAYFAIPWMMGFINRGAPRASEG